MLMPIEDAAKVFAVPQDYFYDSVKSIEGAIVSRGGERWVDFDKACRAFGIGGEVFRDLRQGREWLMTFADIHSTYGEFYGHSLDSFERIAGEPAIADNNIESVYRVSSFVKFLRLSAEERIKFLEGANGSRNKTAGKKVRRSPRGPRKDNPPSRKRGGPPKRLGS